VPIYNQIKSANMTNVLVAVVRYYGGTNLGVPGLVKAYGSAAAEALAFVATQLALDEFSLTFHVMPSKVGVVYDLARKAGAGVSLKEMHTDGSQSLNVFGKGSPNILAKTIQDKIS
jgi:putative IMPACT (imprinted ancient) family translation regulator